MGKETYDPEFWGLDLETSSSDSSRGGTIQVGLVAPNGEVFCSLVGGWAWVGNPKGTGSLAEWNEEAAAVHNISRETLETAPWRWEVDIAVADFIMAHTKTDRVMNRIPVGWNVGSFDMPFFRKDFLTAGKLFSYRSTDLNSILFAMIKQDPSLSFPKIKDKVKKMSAEGLGGKAWHDAGFDARAAMATFKILAESLGKEF